MSHLQNDHPDHVACVQGLTIVEHDATLFSQGGTYIYAHGVRGMKSTIFIFGNPGKG